MKYTKDDLAKMGDDEINKVICRLVTGYELPAGCCFDFVDNWNELMPLAVEHDIIHDFMCTEDGGKLFSAYPATDDENITIDFWCDTLQRAIACRLILVLQERE